MIDPLPGDIFRKGQLLNNTYEIEGVIGRGGTGEVYRARNQITGRVVAVKALNRALSANEAYLALVRREEEMRAIASDAVVRYTDCSRTDDGHVYLVMDFVDGAPLSDWLERGGARPRDLLVVAHRVAEGLVATHARQIVHRDLSPDNIVLRGGAPEQAVIIDFGIAKDASAGARTIVGNDFAGKYEYAAPEQLHGRAEPRSDLYALGALLLATFRGAVPDVGGSPGEVVARKQRPPDTTGVPEPLRGLIDDLTQPDPARRPPSAAAVVAAIDAMLKPAEAAAPRRSRRWLPALPLLALVALGGAWAGGLLDRLLAPSLPTVSPYTLVAERGEDGRATLAGHAPDASGRALILSAFAAASGAAAPEDAVPLAAGAPSAEWPAAAAALIGEAAPLASWRLEITGAEAYLAGVAPDRAARDAVAAGFAAAARAAGLDGRAELAAGPASLAAADVRDLIAALADCGPLDLTGAADAMPLGATVAVAGDVADRSTADRLRATLEQAVGDRPVRVDATVLNPALCTVLRLLPAGTGGGVSIALGEAATTEPNLTGVYRVGDNPTIDVLVPADAEGHLWVAVADVGGNLFNLLPNIARPDSALAALGEPGGATRRIRVAFGLQEAAGAADRPAFTIDETFGKSMVIVFRTDRPLFADLRPMTESVEGFAEALGGVLAGGSVRILSTATRMIDSRK
ncbi:MAG TPA: protein kinase [Amaricoccus sp.]|nr:protein kinase [Amaricoccus sp.]